MNGFRYFIDLQESVSDYLPELFKYFKDAPDDALVHFGLNDKVGINPKPAHQDPIGIYTFPKKYVLSSGFNKNSHFFGMPYVFVLKLNDGAKILNLSTLTDTEVDKMIEKMDIGKHQEKERDKEKPGHKLWNTIESAINHLARYGKRNIHWNKFFKRIGDFDALVDEGDAIIHSNEPYQVVILNPRSYTQLTKFQNSVGKIYKNLALRLMHKISAAVFQGDFRVSVKPADNYGRIRVSSAGTANGRQGSISLVYDSRREERQRLSFPLQGTIHLGIRSAIDYPDGERVEIPLDEPESTMDAIVQEIVKKLQIHAGNDANFRQNMTPYVQELMKQVCAIMGFGRVPKIEGNTNKRPTKRSILAWSLPSTSAIPLEVLTEASLFFGATSTSNRVGVHRTIPWITSPVSTARENCLPRMYYVTFPAPLAH